MTIADLIALHLAGLARAFDWGIPSGHGHARRPDLFSNAARVRPRDPFGAHAPLLIIILLALLAMPARNSWALDSRVPVRLQPIVGLAYGLAPEVAPGTSSPTAVCTLNYYGGPLTSNVQVVPVLWSSFVNAQITANIAQFYTDVTVSTLQDFLSEYAAVGGTHQSIGRGSATAAITLTPSVCATGSNCTVTDAQLQTELAAQIAAGHLPAPQLDAAGYANTAYMVHFPTNVSVNRSGSVSCVQYCAYHGTGKFGAANTPFPYGVLIDTSAPGCSGGCGASLTAFNNTTSYAAHELAEVVTDTDVGLASSIGPPIAWYSSTSGCGEIGDICNAQQTTITVGGRTWTVQKEWSNAQAKCTATGIPPNYAVSAPATAPAGTAFSFGVTARNPYTNSNDTAYVGTVHFTSSDPGAVLPADFTFIPEDSGTLSFMATLNTQGSRTITATDTLNGAIVGTSASINVTTAVDSTTLSTACPTKFVENQSITLMATVSNGVNPTGSVAFADGPTVFCGNAALASGAASCQTPPLLVQGGGTSYVYNPTASYSGDGSNGPSASASLPLTVLAATDVLKRAGFEAAIVGCPTP